MNLNTHRLNRLAETRIRSGLTFFFALIVMAHNASAANVKLVPTGPVVNVVNGDMITFDIVIDFTDVGGPLGGAFDLAYVPDDLKLTDIQINAAAGDPDFHDIRFISQITGFFTSWAVGSFDPLPDVLVVGSLGFEVKPGMPLDTTITTSPTRDVGGPWISGTDFLSLVYPNYNHLVITRTDGIGSVCGDSLLYTGETCDDGNANGGDGCTAVCTIEPGYECTLPIPGDPPTPSVCTLLVDTDSDLIVDVLDNCTLVGNFDQVDTDNDGIGNSCDPDFDNSRVVNFSDYFELTSRFGSTTSPLHDLTNDGVINFLDIAVFGPFFLQPPGPSGLSNICE